MVRLFITICVLIGVIGSQEAMAHRLPVATMTIAHVGDADVGEAPATQVTLRIHGGDAFKVLEELGAPALSLDNVAIGRLVNYAGARMTWNPSGMTPMGGEVDGNWVFLYWEGEGHDVLDDTSLLSDISKDWMTQVTVISPDGERSSRAFHKGAKPPVHRHD